MGWGVSTRCGRSCLALPSAPGHAWLCRSCLIALPTAADKGYCLNAAATQVQDLTPAQIALFKYTCVRAEEGMLLAGDTAQTIARGTNFRFEVIRYSHQV